MTIKRWLGAILILILGCGLADMARAADAQGAMALVDKGIAALGGADRLNKIKAVTWTTVETIPVNGALVKMSTTTSVAGITRYRQEIDSQQGGAPLKRIVILGGDKGISFTNGNRTDMAQNDLATLKQLVYLTSIPVTLLPLKDSSFKLDTLPDETVNNTPAAVIKVTPPDNRDFKLYFAKDTGLPVRISAQMTNARGAEFTLEMTYNEYQMIDGLNKAMKIVTRRDGRKFQQQNLMSVSVVEKVDPTTFEKP
jgi:negative regulator of sigma E activity